MALPDRFMDKLWETQGDPSAFSELVFGTAYTAGQRRYARSSVKDVNFLLPGNSWGKTEFILRHAFYCAFWKDGIEWEDFESWYTAPYRELIASYTYPVAEESFERLETGYDLREELRMLLDRKPTSSPTGRAKLSNGSRLYWGSLDGAGKLVEAKRLNRIWVDEAGHIPDLSSTFDNILFPRTMGVNGKVHLLGTPKAHSDPYLLEVFEKGKGEDPFYYAQSGSVFENEFWPEDERLRVLANPRYVRGWIDCPLAGVECPSLACREGKHPLLTPIGRQVIEGAFIIAGGFFFNRFHVDRMFQWDPEWPQPEWTGENQFRIPPSPNRFYMGAFDLGGNKGRTRKKPGSDPTVGFVIDFTERPWRVVRYDYIEGGEADWEQKYELMKQVYLDYHLPYLIIDATGQIDSVQEALEKRGVVVEGIHFGGAGNKKYDMLRNLQLVTEMEWREGVRGLLRCPPIPKLKYELDHYVWPDTEIQQDTVMALAMDCFDIAQYELPAPVGGDVW